MHENLTDLLKQIALGEDSVLELKTVEFSGDKITGPHRSGMADELAAMANTAAGVIVLGVDDKTRAVQGIPAEKLDIVEGWIRSICNDSIEPPLDCFIRKLAVPDEKGQEKIILRVDVPQSLFVHKGPNGYFRRIGSSKREMKPDVLARLFQQRSQTRLIRFDEQPVPNTSADNLNPQIWNRFRTVLSSRNDHDFLENQFAAGALSHECGRVRKPTRVHHGQTGERRTHYSFRKQGIVGAAAGISPD
jgi:predicted HTH transcriptional regulator